MQANTPEPKIKKINLERKVVKLNEVMWGSYRYLKEVLGPGDFLIPMEASMMSDDTLILVVKVLKAKNNS